MLITSSRPPEGILKVPSRHPLLGEGVEGFLRMGFWLRKISVLRSNYQFLRETSLFQPEQDPVPEANTQNQHDEKNSMPFLIYILRQVWVYFLRKVYCTM